MDRNSEKARIQKNSFLSRNNTGVYVPTAKYHPATKDYVDDAIGGGTATPTFDSLTVTNDTTTGSLKVGAVGAGNYLNIDTSGTLTLLGAATTYRDLQFEVSAGRVPAANFPAYETFTTNTRAYSFAVNDYIDLKEAEIPHDWKLASVGAVHMHVTTKAANATGSNRFAKFTVYIAYANTTGVWTETSLTAELTIPTGTAVLTKFYLDLGNLDLTGYGLETYIKPRIKRIAATGGTEYTGSIFINQTGLHYIVDSLGSNTETTK